MWHRRPSLFRARPGFGSVPFFQELRKEHLGPSSSPDDSEPAFYQDPPVTQMRAKELTQTSTGDRAETRDGCPRQSAVLTCLAEWAQGNTAKARDVLVLLILRVLCP